MPARSIEQIRNLCKRRGFIFPGSAAYGGLGSFWDYGPLGVEMLNHIKRAWWKAVVYERDDMEGLDSAIITSRKVWQHSGHEATFSDPLVDNKKTGKRYRLDHLLKSLPQPLIGTMLRDMLDVYDASYPDQSEQDEQRKIGPFQAELRSLADIDDSNVDPAYHMVESGSVRPWLGRIWLAIRTMKQSHPDEYLTKDWSKFGGSSQDMAEGEVGEIVALLRANRFPAADIERLIQLFLPFLANYEGLEEVVESPLNRFGVADPTTGQVGDWTVPRKFNLMFQTHVGAVEGVSGMVYLRPETAQGIFMNFKHVQTSLRRKVPFGVAQIGKAFRNEITPGNFIFRTREFEQMEIEFFIKPPQFSREGDKTDEQWHAEWIDQRYNWWIALGVDPARLRKRAQDKAELAHYAKATTDLEYLFPDFGWGEVEGVANRTDFDLSAHSRDVPEDDLKRLKLEKNTDSTETFDYFDPDAKARYIPWVIEPSAGVTRAMLTFLCEAYHEELVKEPTPAEVDPLKVEIDAVIKNALKKVKEAEKASRESAVGSPQSATPDTGHSTPDAKAGQAKHDPAAINEFVAKLEEMKQRLPQSLLEIDNLLEDHAGAQNLEPAKKLKPKVAKLAEDCVRVVLRLHPALAPVKVAVFPLKKNAPEIVDIARRITRQLSPLMRVQFDDSAGIGRLYRRQDEIGTPFCITVDFDTLQDNTVTLRERDSMQQTRVKIDDLKGLLMQRLHLA